MYDQRYTELIRETMKREVRVKFPTAQDAINFRQTMYTLKSVINNSEERAAVELRKCCKNLEIAKENKTLIFRQKSDKLSVIDKALE